MAWRKPKDPLLTTARYRRNREVLKRQRLLCAVCGRPIDYSQPGAFVAGHVVARHKAKRLGWTEEMINALSNLRAECKSCSYRTGAHEGNQVKRAMRQRVRPGGATGHLTDSHRW